MSSSGAERNRALVDKTQEFETKYASMILDVNSQVGRAVIKK